MLKSAFSKDLFALIVILALTYIAITFFIPEHEHYDVSCWRKWTLGIFEQGLGKAYSLDLDYNPFLLYFFSEKYLKKDF